MIQFMERLPDRQAADACAWDGRWKVALQMDVDEPGFHATTPERSPGSWGVAWADG